MRGVQVTIKHSKGLKVVVDRVSRPKNGGGVRLAEFSNVDGTAVEEAMKYIKANGHKIKEVKACPSTSARTAR